MKARWLLVALAFCGVLARAEEPALTADGYGKIQIGMKVDQLERYLGRMLGYNPFANHGCSLYTTPQLEAAGLSLVIDTKLLVRINVDYYSANSEPRRTKTPEGIGLSVSEAELLKTYGAAAAVKPNPADPTWHTVTVDNADHSRGLVFETDGKTVKSMRAGAYPFISASTSCP